MRYPCHACIPCTMMVSHAHVNLQPIWIRVYYMHRHWVTKSQNTACHCSSGSSNVVEYWRDAGALWLQLCRLVFSELECVCISPWLCWVNVESRAGWLGLGLQLYGQSIQTTGMLCRHHWFCPCGCSGCCSPLGCPPGSLAGCCRMGNQDALSQYRQTGNQMQELRPVKQVKFLDGHVHWGHIHKWLTLWCWVAYLAEHLSVSINQKSGTINQKSYPNHNFGPVLCLICKPLRFPWTRTTLHPFR